MVEMKYGDIALVAGGSYTSKPRPVLIVQHNEIETGNSIIVVPFTSVKNAEINCRVKITPSKTNGLDRVCYLEVDKISAIDAVYLGDRVGTIEQTYLTKMQQHLKQLIL